MGTTMADTAHLDNLEELNTLDEEQLNTLADMLRASKHAVFFTGAGISTSAAIPDFRGPDGVWTREAQGGAAPQGIEMTAAIPTPAHMAMVALQDTGVIKHVISQNVDWLHRRSGIRADMIS